MSQPDPYQPELASQKLGPGVVEFEDSTSKHFDELMFLPGGSLDTYSDAQRTIFSAFFWTKITYADGTKTMSSAHFRTAPNN